MKRFLSVLLAAVLVFAAVPQGTISARADEHLWDVPGVKGGRIAFDSSTGTITDCTSRVTVADIPSTINGVKVTSIDNWAFASCTSLTSVTLPSSVVKIGKLAFFNCEALTSVTLPKSLTSIGSWAFQYCPSLTSITVPNSVTSFGDAMFDRCASLTSFTFPDHVTKIGNTMFDACISLTSVTIPSSVTSIGNNAFSRCTSLKDIYYAGSPEQWKNVYVDEGNDLLAGVRIHYGSAAVSTSSGSSKTGTTVKFNGIKKTDLVLNWDAQKLFAKSPEVPSNDLAMAALVLSANAYDAALVKDTLKVLGFTRIDQQNYDGYDGLDRVGVTFGCMEEIIDGQLTNVIAVVCRGSSNAQDWISNLGTQSLGFETAADDVREKLGNFIGRINTGLPAKFFITGHSRGAAVANILGAKADESENYVYTFACPNVASKKDAGTFKNIFNVLNSEDVVAFIPPIPSKKHGQEKWFTRSAVKGFDPRFASLTGEDPADFFSNPLNHHSTSAYMAFLQTAGIKAGKSSASKTKISVKCPVDVAVYDQNHRLLGKIVNNTAEEQLLKNGVLAVIEGDEKTLYAPCGMELSLELEGTDAGAMEYSVESVDTDTGETLEKKTFQNVELAAGKKMASTVAIDIPVPETALLLQNTESRVVGMIDTAGAEQEAVVLSFSTGPGETLHDMAVPKGQKAENLPSAHRDGYSFAGWYTDAALQTPFDTDAVLTENLILHAAYTKKYGVCGNFSEVTYNGTQLQAVLEYDYNDMVSTLYTALYKDGKILRITAAPVKQGTESSAVTLPAAGLFGTYQLKAFSIDPLTFLPCSEAAEISFYAD